MANFNKVFLIGNLTRDPQLSYTPNQTAVVDFGLAVNRRWKGQDGEAREETCFVDCRAFGRPAENINKYLTKGRPLFVEGRLTFNSWTAQDGTKRSKHRVTVESFQFLGGPRGAGGVEEEVEEKIPEAKEEGGDSVGTDDIPF
ncbi:MAG: single-stranded DNA-binding protein [Sedimentisphaerales bacterium]